MTAAEEELVWNSVSLRLEEDDHVVEGCTGMPEECAGDGLFDT